MKTVYRSLTALGSKTGKCGCGIVRKRSQQFHQTVNPYNKNPDGTVKTADDIRKELEAHLAAWNEAPIYCVACRPSPPPQERNTP